MSESLGHTYFMRNFNGHLLEAIYCSQNIFPFLRSQLQAQIWRKTINTTCSNFWDTFSNQFPGASFYLNSHKIWIWCIMEQHWYMQSACTIYSSGNRCCVFCASLVVFYLLIHLSFSQPQISKLQWERGRNLQLFL